MLDTEIQMIKHLSSIEYQILNPAFRLNSYHIINKFFFYPVYPVYPVKFFRSSGHMESSDIHHLLALYKIINLNSVNIYPGGN